MAEQIKYLSLAGLQQYDGLIKEYIGKQLSDLTEGDVAALQSLVTTLVGTDAAAEGETQKSIRTIANEELAKQLIPDNAKEALDTLQEIAAWIQKHPEDAAAMNAAIEANAAAIGAAKPGVGNEGEDGYVAPVAASGLTKRVDDLEDLMGDDSVKDQIDAAIDALGGSATGSDAVENTAAEGEPSNAVPAKVTVTVTSENGEVNSVAVTTNDIASAADLAALTTEVGDDDTATSVKGRVKALEDLFGDGEGSVSDQIQDAIDSITGTLGENDATTLEAINDVLDTINGDASTTGSIAKAAADAESNANDYTDEKIGDLGKKPVPDGSEETEGEPYTVKDYIDEKIDSIIAINNEEIDALFDGEEESTQDSDIIGG